MNLKRGSSTCVACLVAGGGLRGGNQGIALGKTKRVDFDVVAVVEATGVNEVFAGRVEIIQEANE